MKKSLLLAVLCFPFYAMAEQFVEVTTELQVDYFDNWLFLTSSANTRELIMHQVYSRTYRPDVVSSV